MSARDWLNQNQVVFGVLAVLVLLAAVVIFRRSNERRVGVDRFAVFYSDDDGQTYFPHVFEVPPFDHKGREAVWAYVFTCDGGTTTFVAYLQKYTAEARRKLVEAELVSDLLETLPPSAMLLKRPEDSRWTSADHAEDAAAIRRVSCPEGRRAEAVLAPAGDREPRALRSAARPPASQPGPTEP